MQVHEFVVIFSAIMSLVALIILSGKRFSLHPVLSLLTVALFVGLINNLGEQRVVAVMRTGAADSFGNFGLVITLGAIFGRLLIEAGVTQKITKSIANVSHPAYAVISVVILSFFVSLPLFFEVGMIILIPIIYAVADALRTKAQMRSAFTILIMSSYATLSTIHALLPPHPGPTTVSHLVGANIGLVTLIGLGVAIPIFVFTGPLYSWCAARWLIVEPPQELDNKIFPHDNSEGIFEQKNLTHHIPVSLCYFLVLLPVLLIMPSSIVQSGETNLNSQFYYLTLVGNPIVALIISVFVMMFVTMYARSLPFAGLNPCIKEAIGTVAGLVILLSAGGALSRMLFVIGVQDVLEELMNNLAIPALVLAWALAALVGTASGSATVAATTTAQLTVGLMPHGNAYDQALLVLVIGCGSIFCNYTTHGSYWMIKDAFGLSMKQSTLIVTVLSTMISLLGLAFVGGLYYFFHVNHIG